MTHSKKKQIFSFEEAEALLPELEKRLRFLQAKKETYSRLHDALFVHELVCNAEHSNGLSEENDGLESGIHALEEAIEELAKDVEAIFSLGCILRDIEKGEVEFLGSYQGKKVYFSWKTGEPYLRYYRPANNRNAKRVEISRQ